MSYRTFFRTKDEVTQHIDVPADFKLDRFQSPLFNTQQLYVKGILGTDFYNSMIDEYNGSSLEGVKADLVTHIQFAVSHMAMRDYIPSLNVSIGVGGLTTTKTETSTPASQYRVEERIRYHARNAAIGFDRLIDFLFENQDDADLSGWTDETKQTLLGNFVTTTQEFQEFTHYDVNRFVLWRMVPVMTRIEEDRLRPTMCEDFYDSIKGRLKIQSEALEEAPLPEMLRLARRAVVHLTLAESARFLGLQIDNEGMYFVNREAVSGQHQKTTQMSVGQMDQIIRMEQQRGEEALENLREFLENNAEAIPEFNSCAGEEDTEEVKPIEPGSGVFPMM